MVNYFLLIFLSFPVNVELSDKRPTLLEQTFLHQGQNNFTFFEMMKKPSNMIIGFHHWKTTKEFS